MNQTRRMRNFSLLAALAMASAASSHGAAVLTDDFNAYSDGNLSSQGGWSTATAGTASVQAASGAVSMSPAPSGSTLEIVRKGLGQSFNTAGTSLYYGVDINVSAAGSSTGSGDWVMGFSSTGSSYGNKLFVKSSSTGGYLLGWYVGSGSASVQYGTTSLALGTPVRVVMRYDFVSGTTNDTGAVYVIPSGQSDVSTEAPYLYLSTGSFAPQADVATIAAINFHQGGTGGPTMTLDNLAVGGWSDVAAVPEPTMPGLAALSGGLLLYRRRSI